MIEEYLKYDVEQYQDVWVKGEAQLKGIRQSHERYEIFKPYVSKNSVIMDIGSCYGYFGLRLAEDLNCLTWSIEPDPVRIRIQKEIIKANETERVLLSGKKVDVPFLEEIYSTVETIDTILAFSVAHYWKPEETAEIIEYLAKLAPQLIIEVAQPNEKIVANKDKIASQNIMEELQKRYTKIEKIGHVPSSKDPEVKRPIYLCSNDFLVREAKSYLDSKSGRRHNLVYQNGTWSIDGEELEPALNLHNVIKHDLRYPNRHTFLKEASKAYYDLKQSVDVTDVRSWNILVTEKGLKPIDWSDDKFVSPTRETVQQYRDRIKQATQEDIQQEIETYL